MSENNAENSNEATEKKAPRGKKSAGRGAPKEAREKRSDDKGATQAQAAGSAPAVDLEERVVAVNRVAKVVKGGRRFSFAALVIVGDKKGRIGYGLGKAKEVPDAIRKASQEAAKKMIAVPLENGTIPHQVLGEYDAGKILFKPAAEGTGIKAGGACRTILELAGVRDVLTKSLRGSNPHNVVKATFKALKNLRSIESIAAARGMNVKGLRLGTK